MTPWVQIWHLSSTHGVKHGGGPGGPMTVLLLRVHITTGLRVVWFMSMHWPPLANHIWAECGPELDQTDSAILEVQMNQNHGAGPKESKRFIVLIASVKIFKQFSFRIKIGNWKYIFKCWVVWMYSVCKKFKTLRCYTTKREDYPILSQPALYM